MFAKSPEKLRIAYFHTELSAEGPGLLLRDLTKAQLPEKHAAVLSVIASVAPDILLLSGIDYDAHNSALHALRRRLTESGIHLPYAFAAASNRGVPTGLDVDGDGRFGEPEDAQGYGAFRGAGGMALLSRYPVLEDRVQVFSTLLWADLPDANLPFAKDGAAAARITLSESGHWDVPVRLPNGAELNLLTLHASPPVFDGPDDRNGRRNADQIRFWVDYLNGWHPVRGSAEPPANSVVLGTLNADPEDGDARRSALHALLRHPLLQDPEPGSMGGQIESLRQGGVNFSHQSPASRDTVDWPDEGARSPGNLRVDYVLPARSIEVVASGVYWPTTEPAARTAKKASRHRLVWVDVAPPPAP